MKPETKVILVKELEKIKAYQGKNNYTIAWYILSVTMISLIIFLAPLDKFLSGTKWSLLFSIITLLCLLTVIFQSLFVIIRYTVDKRLKILFEAILDGEKE